MNPASFISILVTSSSLFSALGFRFEKIIEYNETQLSSYPYGDTASRSTLDCARQCLSKYACWTFVYDAANKQCQMFSVTLTKTAANHALTGTKQKDAYVLVGQECEDYGYVTLNGSRTCYKLNRGIQMTHAAAMIECEISGGYLARIESQQEHQLIYEYVVSVDPTIFSIYIDGSDELVEDDWLFSDGSKMTYLNWLMGEPAVCCKDFEECLGMMIGSWGMYNDIHCSNLLYFICEKER